MNMKKIIRKLNWLGNILWRVFLIGHSVFMDIYISIAMKTNECWKIIYFTRSSSMSRYLIQRGILIWLHRLNDRKFHIKTQYFFRRVYWKNGCANFWKIFTTQIKNMCQSLCFYSFLCNQKTKLAILIFPRTLSLGLRICRLYPLRQKGV